MKETKKEVEKILFNLELSYNNEDKKNLQNLINSYFRNRNIPNSKIEFIIGGLLWVYSRINFLFENDINWSQKEIAKKLNIESKSISRTASYIMKLMNIDYFDKRFARKEISKKDPRNNFIMTKEGFIVDKNFIEDKLLENMRQKFGDTIDIKSKEDINFINSNNKKEEDKDIKNKKLGEFF